MPSMPSSVTPRASVRRAVAVVSLAAVAVGGVALAQARSASLEAQTLQRAAAEREVLLDLENVRASYAAPAMAARRNAASLRLLVADALTGDTLTSDVRSGDRPASGDGFDADTLRATVSERSATLHRAAGELEEASGTTRLVRPERVDPSQLDGLRARLHPIASQAVATAALLRDAADDAEATSKVVLALHAAATDLVEHTAGLPTSDDPEVIAAAWEAERERVERYLDAIDATDEFPALAQLHAVHHDVAEGLAAVADQATELLAAGKLDAYNDRLAEHLGTLHAEDLRDELHEATLISLTAAVADIEAAEEHALGLLHALEGLRRDAPTLLAGG
jgi:hypothetical protein